MRTVYVVIALATISWVGCDESAPPPSATSETNGTPEETTPANKPVTEQDVRSEAQEALQTAQELVAQEQRAYREQVSARLDKLKQHIADLQQQLKTSPPTAGVADLQETFASLEQQLADAREQAEKETADTREAWDEVRASVDEAVGQLEASMKEARQQLENEKKQKQGVTGDEQGSGNPKPPSDTNNS